MPTPHYSYGYQLADVLETPAKVELGAVRDAPVVPRDVVTRASAVAMLLVADQAVGWLAEVESGWVPFIESAYRGQGLGDRVAELAQSERRPLALPTDNPARDYFVDRGFGLGRIRHGWTALVPPSLRSGVVEAASVALYHPHSDALLLGCRKTSRWLGYWSFPGGVVELAESRVEAALRELREETGLRPTTPQPQLESVVHVSTGPSETVFEVSNFLFFTDQRQSAVDTDELTARWFPRSDAVQTRPMAAGTRRVLRRIGAFLAADTSNFRDGE